MKSSGPVPVGQRSSLPLLLLAEQASFSPPVPTPISARGRSSTFSSSPKSKVTSYIIVRSRDNVIEILAFF